MKEFVEKRFLLNTIYVSFLGVYIKRQQQIQSKFARSAF